MEECLTGNTLANEGNLAKYAREGYAEVLIVATAIRNRFFRVTLEREHLSPNETEQLANFFQTT